jgi:hypothetical protein
MSKISPDALTQKRSNAAGGKVMLIKNSNIKKRLESRGMVPVGKHFARALLPADGRGSNRDQKSLATAG